MNRTNMEIARTITPAFSAKGRILLPLQKAAPQEAEPLQFSREAVKARLARRFRQRLQVGMPRHRGPEPSVVADVSEVLTHFIEKLA
ncbi:hypothetical protein SAMN05421853_1271 [Roseivivax halotolerans]|uniref:Uncharacterized protein n=1 Tax=Roseivivax halotolerans TaxID=93684 RepID=A0A1I6AN07_9RHOB|nr:hypothetical protein SAMN05421853_1271 [Roseivivax halotolerans]